MYFRNLNISGIFIYNAYIFSFSFIVIFLIIFIIYFKFLRRHDFSYLNIEHLTKESKIKNYLKIFQILFNLLVTLLDFNLLIIIFMLANSKVTKSNLSQFSIFLCYFTFICQVTFYYIAFKCLNQKDDLTPS